MSYYREEVAPGIIVEHISSGDYWDWDLKSAHWWYDKHEQAGKEDDYRLVEFELRDGRRAFAEYWANEDRWFVHIDINGVANDVLDV